MPAPVELALSTLLPTISFLPPDLISLASSLLAQSRAKASNLRPDEEIARTYVCAHLACSRLQKGLDLEIGKPAPPVKPRVYDKLYKFLDSALSTPRTPQANRFKDAVGTGSAKTSARKVDATEKEEVKTPTTSGRKRAREEDVQEEKEIPDFVMPMIRAMCKATNIVAAAPHVHVGATAVAREIVSRNQKHDDTSGRSKRRRTATPRSRSIATPAPARESSHLAIARWPALLVTLHCLTAARLKDVDIDDAVMKTVRATAIETAESFCHDGADTLPSDLTTRLNSLDADVGFYRLEAEDCGWLDMEWYHNIPLGQIDEEEAVIADSEDDDEDEENVTPMKRSYKTPLRRKEKHGGKILDLEGNVGAAGLAQGLGTMFQPAVDWLSDERRAEFVGWKKGIMKEIAAVEQKA